MMPTDRVAALSLAGGCTDKGFCDRRASNANDLCSAFIENGSIKTQFSAVLRATTK